MYDTIKIYFKWLPYEYKDRLKSLICRNDGYRESMKQENGEVVRTMTGYYKNLTITISPQLVYISGSIAVYYLGTNLHSLNRNQTVEAIEQLERELMIPVKEAAVSRVDVGVNIIVDSPPANYIELFEECRYLTRSGWGENTLYYKSKTKEFCIYDKILERKDKKEEIPADYEGKYVLRCELRLRKNPGKVLNCKSLALSCLTNPDIYMLCSDLLYKHYSQIQKKAIISSSPELTEMTVAKAKDVLLGLLLSEAPAGTEEAYLKHLKSSGVFVYKKDYSLLKRKFREIKSLVSTEENTGLIVELDGKMKEFQANCLFQ